MLRSFVSFQRYIEAPFFRTDLTAAHLLLLLLLLLTAIEIRRYCEN